MGSCEFVSPNLSYSEETFGLVTQLAPLIRPYSSISSVPPIAVAGSIADEFNTRAGFKSAIDWFQDDVLLNYMPSSFIKLDVKIGSQSKLLNAIKHDIGKGNIKLETARVIFMNYRDKFSRDLSDWSELVDFIRATRERFRSPLWSSSVATTCCVRTWHTTPMMFARRYW